MSRTPEFVKHLKDSGTTPQEIERMRGNVNKMVGIGMGDTLSDHFHHEARNAFAPFTIEGVDVEFNQADFDGLRQRLLNVRNATGWFKEEGPLSKQEITDFLDKVEQQGEWDIPIARRIKQMAQPLFDKFPKE